MNLAEENFKEKSTEKSTKEVSVLLTQEEQIMKFRKVTVKRKPGTKIWWARFQIKGEKFIVYGKTQAECYQHLKEAMTNGYSPNQVKKKSTYTLKSWYDYFMRVYKKEDGNLAPGTIKDNDRVFNHFKAYFENNLSSFKEITIKNMINSCNGARGKQKAFILLRSIFKKAVSNCIIKKDPTADLSKPVYEAPEKLALTESQQKQFLEQAQKIENKIHGDFLSVCLLQGFTRGECWGITNEKLDFEKNTITINECIKESDDNTKTKNKYRNRTVPMFRETRNILEQYKSISGRIFDIKPGELYLDLKHICKLAQIPEITIHELRHTFITRCQEQGIPLYLIQLWVGHRKGSKITTQVYTHVNTENVQEYVDKMNKRSS